MRRLYRAHAGYDLTKDPEGKLDVRAGAGPGRGIAVASAIFAAAVGFAGQENEPFRRVLGWSLALPLIMCAIVLLQSTAVLSWMVV